MHKKDTKNNNDNNGFSPILSKNLSDITFNENSGNNNSISSSYRSMTLALKNYSLG